MNLKIIIKSDAPSLIGETGGSKDKTDNENTIPYYKNRLWGHNRWRKL